jgi:hypothetical protein
MKEFEAFKKIPRLNRDMIVTEKIDGTNSQIVIEALEGYEDPDALICKDGLAMYAGSRSRWLTPKQDNFGFARWVLEHSEELFDLGIGRHFGEWWGQGIQRGYGLKEKRFSLFNTARWSDDAVRPSCCHVVPVLHEGLCSTEIAFKCIAYLKLNGSEAVPGWMKPEGIVVFHVAGNLMFKATIEKDEKHKGEL